MDSPLTRPGPLAIAALSALALVGCASMNVSSFAARDVDFQRYHTYTWGPAGDSSTGDPRLDNNEFFDQRVRAQIDRQLAGKGLAKAASTGAPDLLVHYHASVTQKVDISELDQQYAYRDDVDRRPRVYDAGTLVVDLVDPRSNTLVWRGWAEGSVEGVIDNQALMEARIDDAVMRILERYPGR